ncbi:hypothetical protein UFOVP1462_48 [uncultured Caudovirales phage]|uniref:Uncharacterized protein n=1 Tax=uncultured Caudovirales phage TaxID=2100421 RepID=A0A6J5Q796_9CAUD|nr:hypothetical protein UFOVP1013_48 [uncultured Caudovirales phage]CAB4202408.1 hypothetical protein UFOVP1364_10 [uncultured Caudovirales phage]CAB4214572.1 hypothetical protein UFOVP1462_48 [uncultured Caudovirales phage]CAB5228530.1 hypothetical protein UFOVP1550_2 [uncultured Caudovirales phage]
MAHFAEIDSDNIVTRVLVVANEQEHRGQEFLADELGLGGTWVQTSYNANFRKNYAGVGYHYDPTNDWFHAPQPFASWTLDGDAKWQPPVPYPTDGVMYAWDEETTDWKATVNE